MKVNLYYYSLDGKLRCWRECKSKDEAISYRDKYNDSNKLSIAKLE